MNFDFANPEFLWALALLPILALLRGASGKNASITFSSIAVASIASKKNKSKAGGIKFTLTLLALALLIIALARPRQGIGYIEREESGIDIMLTVDLSGSMAALDFTTNRHKPLTRLDAVKKVIDEFIRNRSNDRIGMTAFAANAFLVSPMTLNHDWLLQNQERMDIGAIDPNRTAIGSAIGLSVNKLRELKNAKSKVIILLTDGENNAGKISPIAAAEAASTFDIKIYTIFVGNDGRVPIAAVDENQKVIRDRDGNPVVANGMVISSGDDGTLKKIAEITGGKYYRAHSLKQLDAIYKDIDRLEKTKVKLRNFTSYIELFQYFAMAA
ncbi:MAG: VWA domain-containing protein, partial [Opitutales bacterium]|nr:VWA domain-containing protein [Opitutales bacterium]